MVELVAQYGGEQAVAQKLGVSQQTVNRIVGKGEAVGLHVVRQLCQHDGIQLTLFLEGLPPRLGEALRETLRTRRDRWASWTIFAVFGLATEEGDGGRSAEDWRTMLDDVERTLSPVMRNPPTKKR